jgi:hypothetical protein
MKTAKQLLQAYIDGNAQESAALFSENGALELPYLADLGVDPRYEGPKTIGAFLTFLHEKMYPGFKFVDVKIYIDTPDQAFGEYTIHQKFIAVALRMGFAILLPQQLQREMFVRLKLGLQRSEIQTRPQLRRRAQWPGRKQKLIQPLLVQIVRQGPTQFGSRGLFQIPMNRRLSDRATASDSRAAISGTEHGGRDPVPDELRDLSGHHLYSSGLGHL